MITRFLDGSNETLYSSAAGPPVTDDGVVLDASGVRYRIVGSTTAADVTTCTVEPDLDAPTESSFETRVIPSTDGVELRLHHLGGSGDPLLICHATGFHGRAYAPMARLLSERHAVWAVDFRGHVFDTPNLR